MIAVFLYYWNKLRKSLKKAKGPETYERVFYVDCYGRVMETLLRRSTGGQLSVRAHGDGGYERWYEATADGKILNGWGKTWYAP